MTALYIFAAYIIVMTVATCIDKHIFDDDGHPSVEEQEMGHWPG